MWFYVSDYVYVYVGVCLFWEVSRRVLYVFGDNDASDSNEHSTLSQPKQHKCVLRRILASVQCPIPINCVRWQSTSVGSVCVYAAGHISILI